MNNNISQLETLNTVDYDTESASDSIQFRCVQNTESGFPWLLCAFSGTSRTIYVYYG